MALSEPIPAAYETTNARSKIECGILCTNTPDCHVFVYSKHSHSCQFLNISETGSLQDINTTHIGEAYVMPRTDTLLARGKPAESTIALSLDLTADKAVDGRYSDGSSMVATKSRLNPWWRVDLEKRYCIQAVNILNRATYHNRTKNLLITAADEVSQLLYTSDDDENFCGRHDGILNKYYTLIKCASVVAGRFVQLQLNTTVVLNLYEVEVHGYYNAP
ncbi:fucolectin-like [Watersipora subatra]|uniref:fucolectin-like n=1 Tax=Watersipora subatra TaxID=2589382 RepID=UPI00355C6805